MPRFALRQSPLVKAAESRFSRAELDVRLKALGPDGEVGRRLDGDTEDAMGRITSLSSLSAPLALDYLDRLTRPIPALTPEIGVQVVGRGYVAHVVVEGDPGRFGATDIPVLGTLPPLRRGRPPQDLLSRVVKASRKGFDLICALSPEAWAAFVDCLTKRSHDQTDDPANLVPREAVDGLARFAWVLRQVDLHYGLEPDRPS